MSPSERQVLATTLLNLSPSGDTGVDGLIEEFVIQGQKVRPRHGFCLPGSSYTTTNDFSISITSGDTNTDVPDHWFPRLARFIAHVAERGAASLERGDRHQNLHIQAVVTLRFPTLPKGDTKGKALTALSNMIKDWLQLSTARGQPYPCKIIVKPMTSDSHTFSSMLGYVFKDITKDHCKVALSNVSAEYVRQGLSLYKAQTKAFYRGRTRMTKSNFLQLAYNSWVKLFDPYPVPLPKVILWLLQNDELVPDVSWALPGTHHPVDPHKAAAYWRIITSRGPEIQLSDVVEVMFKTDHPNGTSLPFFATDKPTIDDKNQPLFRGFSTSEAHFDHGTTVAKAHSTRLTSPPISEVVIPQDAADHANVLDVTGFKPEEFAPTTFYRAFRAQAANSASQSPPSPSHITTGLSTLDLSITDSDTVARHV